MRFFKKVFPEKILPYVFAGTLIVSVSFLFFGVTKIESESMAPTLQDGDRVLYFRFSSPQRLGIFFIDDPKNQDRELVKRIIGLPGEKIQNGHTHRIIPPNHYYVLGDHRGEYWVFGEAVISLDSRNFGPIHKKNIHERVVLIYWPISRAGWVW